MKNKVIWLLVSVWMVAVLLLTSCAPATPSTPTTTTPTTPTTPMTPTAPTTLTTPTTPTTPTENMVKWTEKKLDGTVVEKMLEKPRYGGIYVNSRDTQPTIFDDIGSLGFTNWPCNLVNETLLVHDWTRGPIGTNEWSPQQKIYPIFDVEVGSVAESWEFIRTEDYDELIYHVRQGIHWQNIPPVNGRELTAADVVYSLRRNWQVGYQGINYRYLYDMNNLENSIFISPTDKWAVVVKVKPLQAGGQCGTVSMGAATAMTHIIAPEVLGTDYKKLLTDWKKVIGTGPFMLQDYVGSSSLTYVRNPNYWGHDPFFPENQLPYVDAVKVLIIPDLSTCQAGMRTGKIDNMYDIGPEAAKTLLGTSPKLQSVSYIGNPVKIYMRNDTKPFNDVRVRQALSMAINYRDIYAYYDGNADFFNFPVPNLPEYHSFYTPLEKLPESVQELYGYHPDKAKQLLTEAGYSNGFKTSIVCWSPEQIDILSIVKEDWAKIGVELSLDVKEYTVYRGMTTRFSYTQGIASEALHPLYTLTGMTGGTNLALINDPEIRKLLLAIQANYFDSAKLGALFTEPTETRPNFITYANEQAWYFTMPAPYNYVIWQPWVKGYGGVKYASYFNDDYPKYIWIDHELKKEMGY